MHTSVFKMDNQHVSTVEDIELFLMLCGSLDGREVWGRMNTCICIGEALSVHPKLSQLLLGYTPT